MVGSYVGLCRIVGSYGILPFGLIYIYIYFKWDSFGLDNPPKPTSPTSYQKPNNELKSQIYPYVNIKSQKNLRDFDDYIMDVDTS